jgi:5-methylthioadenosine/S-adenosylhomocysteine deaminase
MRLDLLLKNVTLLTAEPSAAIVRDGVIGIRGDRIAWLGSACDAAVEAEQVLELPGRVVTPGFVNVHTHSALNMVRGVAIDSGFAPSYTKGLPNALDLAPEDAAALAQLGALEAMLFGSTLIGEHFVHVEACLPELAKLGLRVHASVRLHDVDFRAVANGQWTFDDRIGDALLGTNIAMRERWHGAAEGRVAVQFAAHAADTCSVPFLRRVRDAARAANAIVNTHLAQSTVEVERVKARTGMTPAEVFEDVGLLDEHLLCGHCIYVSDADIARMARAGAHVVHIPKANAASGRMAPTAKLRAAGLNLTLATDTQHADMIELMRWALSCARLQIGKVDDSWQPADVFAMATLNGATAVGLAHEIGSLAVGKKADLVVLDFRRPHLQPAPNALGNLVHTAQGRDVEHVFVDGRCVVRDGRPALVDGEEILARAIRVAEKLWEKAK